MHGSLSWIKELACLFNVWQCKQRTAITPKHHLLLLLLVFFFKSSLFSWCFTSTEMIWLIRDGESPGWPSELSVKKNSHFELFLRCSVETALWCVMFSNALLSLISVCKCLGRQWFSSAFCFQFVNVYFNEKLSCLLEAEGIPTLTQKRSHPELSSTHSVLIKLKVMLHWYKAFEYVYFIIRFRAMRGHHTVTLFGYKNNYSPFGYDGMQSSFHMFYFSLQLWMVFSLCPWLCSMLNEW